MKIEMNIYDILSMMQITSSSKRFKEFSSKLAQNSNLKHEREKTVECSEK
jgi:hypothetical protein